MQAEQAWQGEIWLATDYALFTGATGNTTPHAHYAHQLLVALGEPVQVVIDGQPRHGDFLFIPSLKPHSFIGAPQTVLTIYAEPLAFSAEMLITGLEGCDRNLEDMARRLEALPRRRQQKRVQQALDYLQSQLTDKVHAASLAGQASLSLSQLERLFHREVGLSIRRLVLWRRLYLALSLALQGMSLTQAAHAAGFADAAHFSRSMRKLFGVRADRTLPGLRLKLLG